MHSHTLPYTHRRRRRHGRAARVAAVAGGAVEERGGRAGRGDRQPGCVWPCGRVCGWVGVCGYVGGCGWGCKGGGEYVCIRVCSIYITHVPRLSSAYPTSNQPTNQPTNPHPNNIQPPKTKTTNTEDAYTFFYGERMPLWVRVRASGNTGHGSRCVSFFVYRKRESVCVCLSLPPTPPPPPHTLWLESFITTPPPIVIPPTPPHTVADFTTNHHPPNPPTHCGWLAASSPTPPWPSS